MANRLYGTICLDNIPAQYIFVGQNGKRYININIWENQSGAPDQYGNTHSIQVALSQEQRAADNNHYYIGSIKAPRQPRGYGQQGGGYGQQQFAPGYGQQGGFAPRPQQYQQPGPQYQQPAPAPQQYQQQYQQPAPGPVPTAQQPPLAPPPAPIPGPPAPEQQAAPSPAPGNGRMPF